MNVSRNIYYYRCIAIITKVLTITETGYREWDFLYFFNNCKFRANTGTKGGNSGGRGCLAGQEIRAEEGVKKYWEPMGGITS